MNVFVVLMNAMGGTQHVAICATESEADQRAASNEVGTNTRVVQLPVLGPQSEPNVVYVAQTYDRSWDTHNFEGVYGNYESASKASGPQGQALRHSL